MKCLLVSFHYPPDPAIGGVRVAAIAQALVRAGHEVRVVTAAHPDAHGEDAGMVTRATWFDIRSGRLVRDRPGPAPTTDGPTDRQPAPPAATAAASAASAASADDPATPPSPGIAGRLAARWLALDSPRRAALVKARGAVSEYPDEMMGWIPGALREARRICRTWQCDVVVSSALPMSGHVVAEAIATAIHVPWVADYRDLWSNSTYYDKSEWRRKLDARWERRLLRSATLATVVSEPLADDLRRDFGLRTEVVFNGFDPFEAPTLAQRTPLSDARLNLLYVGDALYRGKRSPTLLFQAAAQLGLCPGDIRFHFLGTAPSLVGAAADAAGVGDLVAFHPWASRRESKEIQSRADALMLLLWNDPREAGVYTGKLYEYIAARRPIVMVGYPDGVAADLIRARGLGHVASTLPEAVEALRAALATKPSNELLPDLDEACSAGLGRGEQTDRLVALIESVVAGR